MQVQLTPEAKIATDFHFIGAIFAVVGFVSALTRSKGTGALCGTAQARRMTALAMAASSASALLA